MKVQGLSLVCSFLGKARRSHLVLDIKWWKLRWVPECKLLKSIPLHIQELNYKKGVYELGDHVGEEALTLNLPLKLGSIRRIPFACFSNCLLQNVWIKFSFPYAFEGAKRNTIGVTRRANSKLTYHRAINGVFNTPIKVFDFLFT